MTKLDLISDLAERTTELLEPECNWSRREKDIIRYVIWNVARSGAGFPIHPHETWDSLEMLMGLSEATLVWIAPALAAAFEEFEKDARFDKFLVSAIWGAYEVAEQWLHVLRYQKEHGNEFKHIDFFLVPPVGRVPLWANLHN